jgi:hypothetical protein
MVENIKLLLGDAANNYSDALINLRYKQAVAEVETYCNRPLDIELEMVVEEIVVIKLNRMYTEGLASQSVNGVSESYVNGYPAHIQSILDSKRIRKVKAL